MCKSLEERIKGFISNSKTNLKCVKEDWKVSTKKDFIIRKNIVYNNDYKYVEFTQWDKEKPICVAIGFNPAIRNGEIL